MTDATGSKARTPSPSPSLSGPVEYHCFDSCNRCAGVNEYEATASEGGLVAACKTKCTHCGFTDYWAYGFFESGSEIESKCQTYSFSRHQ